MERRSDIVNGNGSGGQGSPPRRPFKRKRPTLHDAPYYASRYGWAVIPLYGAKYNDDDRLKCNCSDPSCRSLGKHPIGKLVPRGFIDATTDAELIEQWWTDYPDAFVGIATGRTSGIVVIDVDDKPKRFGPGTLKALEEKLGKLPVTAAVDTPSGGRHLYYKYPADVEITSSNDKFGPGIEIKSDGRYVAAPVGWGWSGRGIYKWNPSPDKVPIADLPAAWIAAMARQPLQRQKQATPPGQWNDATKVKVKEVLPYISPDIGNDDWVKVGMALYRASDGAEDALEIWDSWSSGCPERYTEGECRKRWPSFSDPPPDFEPVTLGTLFHMASEGGWSPQEGTGDREPASQASLDFGRSRSKMSAATQLVELAMERYDFGNSTTDEAYALPKQGARVVRLLRAAKSSLRSELARKYYQETGKTPSQSALADALNVIEGFALEQQPVELHMRVARHNDSLWLDLGDDTGRAVYINRIGWGIDVPPVLFKRTALSAPLSEPDRGGSLDVLWSRLNVMADDQPLVAAWLVAALFPEIPHPILAFFGEQGTGKTTAQKLLVSCIDPSAVPTRKPPRDAETWVTAAAGSWVVGLDNLSRVSDWLSDSLCRAVTGDGDVRRMLYADGDLHVFAYRRAVILNSIDFGAARGDLAERMLPIHLDPISESQRRGEEAIWPVWQMVQPQVVGAILDLAVSVLNTLPTVQLTSNPRMADFAKILAAVDQVLGTSGLDTYKDKQSSLAADSLTGDVFITTMIEQLRRPFTGPSAKLLQELAEEGDKMPKGWPSNARVVTEKLRRNAPALKGAGWLIEEDGGRNHSHAVEWRIVPPEPE